MHLKKDVYQEGVPIDRKHLKTIEGNADIEQITKN